MPLSGTHRVVTRWVEPCEPLSAIYKISPILVSEVILAQRTMITATFPHLPLPPTDPCSCVMVGVSASCIMS